MRTPVVEVTWLDSITWSGWERRDNLERQIQRPDSMLHRSVGYLLDKTDEYILLCQSYQTEDEMNICNSVIIPSNAVKYVRTIETS